MIDDFSPQPVRRRVDLEPPKPRISYGNEAAEAAAILPEPVFSSPSSSVPSEPDYEIKELSHPDPEPDAPKQKPPKVHRWHWQWPPTKRQLLIIGVVVLLLAAAGAAIWAQTHTSVKAVQNKAKTVYHKPAPKAPITVASTLSGLPVDPAVNQRPVTGVMIENSPDARPQSGLDQASVVFEAIAEGGITRFLTLFQDTQPDYLGPVRSARPYYVQWCMGFDCSLGHVGGSPEALQDIKSWGTKNLDQFANAGAYQRISSRYAPHNVYTSTAQLNQLEASKGYGASSFTGFPRKADKPYKAPPSGTAATDTRTPANLIDMNISGYYYNTHYDYDAATNSYKRSEGGGSHMSLHKDGTSVQIQPKVLVVMVMQYGLEADDHHSQYNVIGTGQAFVFQDGTATPATWAKTDMKSQVTFADTHGKPIPLNAGQTWLTALSGANQVTYK
jgi:hypothetical protein